MLTTCYISPLREGYQYILEKRERDTYIQYRLYVSICIEKKNMETDLSFHYLIFKEIESSSL